MSAEGRRSDTAVREQVLDVTRSWLVQAPAGSGKTALLIQRFLALLAIVDRPERIVAMTFTRKAAAEMRERILLALRETDAVTPPPAQSPHALATRRLAAAARRHIDAEGWDLLDQPARLRIVTIDSLAASFARQAPLGSRLGSMPRVEDHPRELHVEAVRDCLAAAPASDGAWRRVLAWLDNDVDLASRLLADMLAGRDRWPVRFLLQDRAALRAAVEAALREVARRAVREVAACMPEAFVAALAASAREALAAFADEAPRVDREDLVAALAALAGSRALPPPDDRRGWRALTGWLLVKDGGLRKRVDKEQGFPAKGSGAGAAERARSKAAFTGLLAKAASLPGLGTALQRLRDAPPPVFDDAGWDFVAATLEVLGRSVDALAQVFERHGSIDFPEQTFRALAALGDADDPGELLLALDDRIAHLLVDEFQDTSAAQLALIARLTAGWERGDGRTFFAVGDPVQSIYRFRKAEVGLFVDAMEREEVAGVPIEVAALTQNFRSSAPIVDWVNAVFGDTLPALPADGRGEVGYAPAEAATGRAGHAPTLDIAGSRAEEAGIVIARLREAVAAGHERVAVLLRARTHAQALLPALRVAGIEYSAVELEAVHARLATRDLLALARALAQPADRLAWFSLLRAPWCGLTLRDLLAVAEALRARGSGTGPFEVIAEPVRIDGLSEDGRFRLAKLGEALRPVDVWRARAPFGLRLRAAWMALGGPACAEAALDLDGAERVFALVDRHARAGDLDDYDALCGEAETLFAEGGETAPGTVQVMTIHHAKGLEFDTVVIPGVDRGARGNASPVLRWGLAGEPGERALVVAPRGSRVGAAREEHPVYAWLANDDRREELAELTRLLYVGATRARSRLHLVGVGEVAAPKGGGAASWKPPGRGSALERIWESLERRALLPPPALAPTPSAQPPAAPDPLRRFTLDWRLPALPAPLPAPGLPETAADRVAFDWAEATAAAIGTVAHRLLAQIGDEGLAGWDGARLDREHPRIVAELAGEGIDPDRHQHAAQQVAAVLARTLADERGRWIFSPEHGDAHSEWALSADEDGRVVHAVLDRSFVAGDVRYIVDFKTGRHEGGDARAFLARELDRYRPQLLRYARIVRALDARPIRIALYHPLVEDGWQEEPVAGAIG